MKLQMLNESQASAALHRAQIALLPLGAVEPHGDHLPLATDNLLAERFCERLDAALGDASVMLPVLPFSQVWSLQGHAGAVDIGNDLLSQLLQALARNMAGYGIPALAVINAHYGNFDAMKSAARALKKEGITLLSYTWAGMNDCVHRLRESKEAKTGYMHADEIETSLMLELAPEAVQMARARAHYPEFPPNFAWQQMHWTEFSDYAVLGDPRCATAEKGAALVQQALETTLNSLHHYLAQVSR